MLSLEEQRLPNNYVPEVRDIDELYKEDADHAENYRQIVDDDDEIHVSGPNIEHTTVLEYFFCIIAWKRLSNVEIGLIFSQIGRFFWNDRLSGNTPIQQCF